MNDSKTNYKDILNPDEYRIAREGATEAPFTGKYCSLFEPGTYLCICCGTPLFSSESKYDSGSGWPDFHAVFCIGHRNRCSSLFLVITEYNCPKIF